MLIVVGLAGSLALVGCGKKQTAVSEKQGITVDLPKLKESFANASPEAQANVTEVLQGARYGEYPRALAALEKLAAMPNLTEDQKTLISRVSDEIKQFVGKGAVPPAR
jgi:hypothetical protein